MFTIDDDMTIYITRGDTAYFSVMAENNGVKYKFQPGDVVRMKVTAKKDCTNVAFQKDFAVIKESEKVDILLTEKETKIGDVISKPVDYWYEIELNPYTNPQTIIGYDDDGAKIFKLFPGGRDLMPTPVDQEDIPVVDAEISLTSDRPVQNQAVTRALVGLEKECEHLHGVIEKSVMEWFEESEETLQEDVNKWLAEHPEATTTVQDGSLETSKFTEDAKLHILKDYVTPQMFGAKGDGVTDDTNAIQAAINSGNKVVIPEGTYKVSAHTKYNKPLTDPGSLYINKDNFEIIGRGEVLLIASDVDTVMGEIMNIANCSNVRVSNITFVGGKTTATEHSEWLYGVNMWKVNGVTIENCVFRDFIGDGLRWGTYILDQTGHSGNITIEDCNFENCYRNCVSVGDNIETSVIRNCVFKNYGNMAPKAGVDIEMEPDGYSILKNVIVDKCYFSNGQEDAYGVHITGGQYCMVKNCIFDVPCSIFTMDAAGLNEVPGTPCVENTFADNTFKNAYVYSSATLSGNIGDTVSVFTNRRVAFMNNTIGYVGAGSEYTPEIYLTGNIAKGDCGNITNATGKTFANSNYNYNFDVGECELVSNKIHKLAINAAVKNCMIKNNVIKPADKTVSLNINCNTLQMTGNDIECTPAAFVSSNETIFSDNTLLCENGFAINANNGYCVLNNNRSRNTLAPFILQNGANPATCVNFSK